MRYLIWSSLLGCVLCLLILVGVSTGLLADRSNPFYEALNGAPLGLAFLAFLTPNTKVLRRIVGEVRSGYQVVGLIFFCVGCTLTVFAIQLL